MTLLKYKDKLNNVMIALTLPAFREVGMEFKKEYAMVLQPIAIVLDRLQSDKFYFYGRFLPTLFVVERKVKPTQCK